MNLYKFYIIVFSVLIAIVGFTGCANVGMITGGEKDTIPPKLLSGNLEQKAVNVSQKIIRLDFSEYIDLKNPETNVIISPPMRKRPDFTTKKKSLIITIKDTLRDNTTYHINFGNAICDITEGNPKKGFSFVFSTGAYIDSLSYAGTIQNAIEGNPEKGIGVFLYRNLDDSAVFKFTPDYIALSAEDGSFLFENLAPGTYRLYAWKDVNADYRYNPVSESFAFYTETVTLPSSKPVQLRLFNELQNRQKLKRARCVRPGVVSVSMARPSGDLRARLLETKENKENKKYIELIVPTDRDDSLIFYTNSTAEEFSIELKTETSCDTSFVTNKRIMKRDSTVLVTCTNITPEGFVRVEEPLQLLFSRPLTSTDESKITLTRDSVPTQGFKLLPTTETKIQYDFLLQRDPEALYRMILLPGAVHDIFGFTNDTVRFSFKNLPESKSGVLILKLTNTDALSNALIELRAEKGTPVYKKSPNNGNTLTFTNLIPGTYILKAYSDNNHNQRHDTGEFQKGTQPESARFFKEKLTIRANWDLEQVWDWK